MRRWLILLGMICPAVLTAGVIEKEISFPESTLSFGKADWIAGYDIVWFPPGGHSINKPGLPSLPQIPLKVIIPVGATATKVEIVSCRKETIKGEFNIAPPPRVAAGTQLSPFVPPDTHVYNSSNPYPSELIESVNTGHPYGYRVATFLVCPLQYVPKERKLILCTHTKLRIHYKEGTYPVRNICDWERRDFQRLSKPQLLNPEDVERFAPPVKKRK